MELLKNWIMYITSAAVLSAVCMGIIPEGRAKKAVSLVCGFVTLLCLAYPITDGRLDELSGALPEFDFSDRIEEKAGETKQIATRIVIQEELGAYILDKGKEMGVEIEEAEVSVRWSDEGYWYPVKAEIRLKNNGTASEEFKNVISQELGIEEKDIYWS